MPKLQLLEEWTKKYDGVFTLWFLWKPIVVASGEKSVREVLITKSNEFAGESKLNCGSE